MPDDLCPVCGKGAIQPYSWPGAERPYNHLPCAQQEHERAEALKAELAALEDRRCEACARAYDDCIHHIQTVNGLADVDYCSEWEQRAMLEANDA